MRNLINQPVETLFLGTDWESLETLKALDMDKRFNIVGVITRIDRPIGRKQILTPSRVKDYAIQNSIKVFHTEKREDRYKEALDIFKPELIVCKAFGEIVPKFFLEYPKYKSINVHFSILPKYRGAVPIQKAILEGEKETGISIMLMTEGLDEGDILKIYREKILPNDTNISLRERLVKKSSEVLGGVLDDWINGKIQPIKQDNSKATYCYQSDISKENAQIKWDSMELEYIERLVRAMIPWPIAWCKLERNPQKSISMKILKILKAELIQDTVQYEPGILFSKNGMLFFSSKKSSILVRVLELQIEGRKRMSEKDFLNSIGRKL